MRRDRQEVAGQSAPAALLPIAMDGKRLGVRRDPPYQGENTDELLAQLGLNQNDIARLRAQRVVA